MHRTGILTRKTELAKISVFKQRILNKARVGHQLHCRLTVTMENAKAIQEMYFHNTAGFSTP